MDVEVIPLNFKSERKQNNFKHVIGIHWRRGSAVGIATGQELEKTAGSEFEYR
jgi:hypothetical protein